MTIFRLTAHIVRIVHDVLNNVVCNRLVESLCKHLLVKCLPDFTPTLYLFCRGKCYRQHIPFTVIYFDKWYKKLYFNLILSIILFIGDYWYSHAINFVRDHSNARDQLIIRSLNLRTTIFTPESHTYIQKSPLCRKVARRTRRY